MNKKNIIAFIIGFAIMASAGSALAQEAASPATTSPDAAAADTLPDAGLTPASPFYFLDRFGDWARVNFFFFNPVKRAEVAAEVANERLAELKEVVEREPQRADIIKELEEDVSERIDEAHGVLERFGLKNKKALRLMKKMENLSLNSQRVMESMLLKNVPEEIRNRTERSLKKVYSFAKKRQQILMEQKEKGLISEAEAEELMNKRIERMKRQIELRAARVEKIKDPVLREKIKGIISEKLNLLEDDIFSPEAMGEEGDGRKIGEMRKEAIKSILGARKRMMLKGATATDEILKDMYEGKMDFKERAGELIEKARETIREVEKDIGEAGTTTPKIIRSAKVLLATAARHLAAAERSFEAGEYRLAFGRAMSAVRTSRAAERIMEKRDDIKERFDYMDEEGREMIDEMKERLENKREFLKEKMRERGESGDREESMRSIIRKKMGEERKKNYDDVCVQVYKPVCGEDGKTYPNKCVAEKQKGIEVRHEGKCRLGEKIRGLNRAKEGREPAGLKVENE